MKKFFAGVICGAAILAAVVVFLPVTAVKIAKLLSTPQDRSKRNHPQVERKQLSIGLPMARYTEKGA